MGALARGGAATVTEIERAVAAAESLLPGVPSPDGEVDERWQAIIAVGDFIQSDPEPVWEFIARWGVDNCGDLRMAVATVLLEHLLEHHFDEFFPRVEELALSNANFADTVSSCWALGETKRPKNLQRLNALVESTQ